ncbi:MAG: hypothetical protein CVU97_00230 [Firmicutes bacterium HGW-Firmicutes-21]|nr:MAG: hypothetical protein CVU97_00230 [Firmicutes bacterium HGW-Firmicutes-21]
MKGQTIKQLGMTLLSVVLICYLVLQLVLNVGDIVELEYVTFISTAKKIELKAFVFRDEVVLTTAAAGTNCFLVEEGEKVKKGVKVAATYSEATDANVRERIKEINAKIAVLEKSGISSGTSTTDLSKIDANISSIMLDIIKAVDNNDLEKAIRNKDALTIQINRRQVLILSQKNYETKIKELENEKTALEATLTGASVAHVANKPGYFYSVVDGYENSFTKAKLQSLSIAEMDTLSHMVPDQGIINDSVGKLVLTPDWYLVCEVDKRTASGFTLGRKSDFAFPYSGGQVLGLSLLRTVSQTDLDRVLLIFTTNAMPEGFNYTRAQTVELISDTYEGLKVSVSALRINNGETGVYALRGNKVIFKKATVLYEENGYYICQLPTDPDFPNIKNKAYFSKTNLSLYDAVISSGRNIFEGKTLQ